MGSSSLDRLLIQLHKLYPKYIDLSFDRILLLLNKLKNPHLKLPPTIHIAGTNGKGSTLSFLYEILKKNKYDVHCYLSPHLESIEERFILSNKKITKKKLFDTLVYIKKINNGQPITFFEITTAAAFYLFSKIKADFLVLETGLGGEFDATNVINKTLIDIITSISFDHKEFLGNNLNKIVIAKLGIIKPKSTIIIGKQDQKINKYIYEKIRNKKNKKLFYGKNFETVNLSEKKFCYKLNNKSITINKPSLIGDHQIENSSIAITAAHELKNFGYKMNQDLIYSAITKTKWPGRLEKGYLLKIPVFIDGAHNISGAKQLKKFLQNKSKKTWVILGMLRNKDLLNFLKIIKNYISGVIAIEIPDEKNSFKTQEIEFLCKKLKIRCIRKKNITLAKKILIKQLQPEQILITGSLYLAGKIRKLFI